MALLKTWGASPREQLSVIPEAALLLVSGESGARFPPLASEDNVQALG